MSSASVACKLCGNAEGNVPYVAREMMYGLRHTFDYLQCPSCETLQIVDFPADMAPYYPSHYYSFNAYDGAKFKGLLGGLKRSQYKAAVFRKGLAQRLWNLVLDVPDYRIFKGLGVDRSTRILDVGCGNGRSFLYPLAAIGFKQLLGADPFIAAPIHYANGLNIQKAGITAITGEWDIITYHHSFEHVPDPLEQLQQVARLLRPGGVCVIRIPTCSSLAWEHYRTNWAQLDAPRHFFLHSRKGMERWARAAGLECRRIVDDSRHFQFSGSEKYVADTALAAPRKRGIGRWVRRKWNKMNYTRRAKQLNREGRGDQAAFFLYKPL